VLRRGSEEIFRPKREEETKDVRKVHKEDIIRMIISRRIRSAEHVGRMGVKRNTYRILIENLNERD
jgi:hypothetical protein